MPPMNSLLRLAACALALLAPPDLHAEAMGVHGMVLFGGRDGLFASHMPMFHRPHDTQVVLQVHLADPRRDAALRRELAARPRLWTIVPDRFDLDRLDPGAADPIRGLRADVVRGHFERGGHVQSRGVAFVIDRVVFDHRLTPTPAAAAPLRYRVVDAGPGAREHFLLHWLDTRPDADHIVRVTTPAPATLPAEIAVPRIGQALSATPVQLQEALHDAGAASAQVGSDAYLETSDLE